MSSSLLFKIKDTVDIDKHRLLELFFKDWVDDTCDNQVNYKVEKTISSGIGRYDIFRVDFETQEDITAVILKGIPQEFQSYLEIVK